jgi:hypothetical protein
MAISLRWPKRARCNLSHTRAIAASIALAALLFVTGPAPGALAVALPCDSDAEQPVTRPVAPASVAAGLQEPFSYAGPPADREAILADVAAVVAKQASELDADACFQQKPAVLAARIDFLSPFEFLAFSLYDLEPARRDALLDQYAIDPRGAIKTLGNAFPSTRTQAILASYAYFDVSSGRIRVNASKVPPDEIRRVLVHEMWHAMPVARTWTEGGSRTLRASGFWLQEQTGGRRLWVPVEERRGLPYASYLLDEGMASLMETRYAGPSRFARADLETVQRYLSRLIDVAGPSEVARQYLGSRPEGLVPLTETHRASFPDLEPVARP